MSIEHTLSATSPLVLGPEEGSHFEFLNNRATVKLAGSSGTMSVVEFLAPGGFGPPQHRHNSEDELFFVLEGQLHFILGDERFDGQEGSFAHLPHGIPHTFQVVSDSARFINVTASVSGHPQFDQMVAALGSPTKELGLPDPSPIDPGLVAEVCAAHDIDIVGPPPSPIE
jgi:quercetin dioxygenase-like cupin family protein